MYAIQKPKTHRDPNAPKRNLSAYLLYQNAMRDHFKALNPGMTFGQLAKYTSAMYAELGPHEKAEWAERAEMDKQRFLQELATYIPPPGYDTKGDLIVPPEQLMIPQSHMPYDPKARRDHNAPRRNLSAYLLYQNAMRDEFKRENPSLTFGQLAKYTSMMYKNMPAQEKAKWDALALEDKARFEREMQTYIPVPTHHNQVYLQAGGKSKRRNKRGKTKEPGAPKRASGAYVFFTNEMRPLLMAEFPNLKFVDLGRVMGERWRALSPEEKKRYEDMASEDKVRFQTEMNDWSSRPPQHTSHVMIQQQPLPVKVARNNGRAKKEQEEHIQAQMQYQQQYGGYPSAQQYIDQAYHQYDPYMHQYH